MTRYRIIAIAFIVTSGLRAPAQERAPRGDDLARNGPKVLAAFRDVVAGPRLGTARVLCGGKQVALGTVVGADGWVLTKASELKGAPVCHLADGRALEARVVGVEEAHDLALLKVDAAGLATVAWRDSKEAPPGSWVASAGPQAEPVAVGVVSVVARRPRQDGYLGVSLDTVAGGVKILRVDAGTPAEKAGLKANDVVVSVDGISVREVENFIELVQRQRPGAAVALRVKRGEEEKDVHATLGKRPADPRSRGEVQNNMGGRRSDRRDGFPIVLQHDTVLRPEDCGGPLVDLDGHAVGVNIARWGRTDSYALPSEAVRPLLLDLMSGKLAPPAAPAAQRPAKERVAEAQAAVRRAEGEAAAARKKLDEAKAALAKAEAELKKEQEKKEEPGKTGDKGGGA